ncbi:hypothetical protein BGZ94_007942 [Podila epigama]|nr:hypothetical protein BGZ94_007942 [Podila epigama]
MSSTTSSSNKSQKDPQIEKVDPSSTKQEAADKPVLALPAPGDADPNINQLEVNGKDLKLDAIGPVVVNEDGTMSRIDNWAEMAEIEKSNVRRILLKRNEQRLKRLRAQRDAEIAAQKEQEQ